ncbi:MAG: 23S rRNA (uracil(1939)-C(5))-methyltransferase RlmD [Dethiobacter sp.]|jgi:23S rRNA (uracil1939-C5)-methyltransferase|nr:23S rRNA (uracil(1939)-C(5))-methyltransferase RlmD [Dethiobacter sp.]
MMKTPKQKPPLSRGEKIQLGIERLNHDGEGVARVNGFTVFVPGAVPGDSVTANVISVQRTYARCLLDSVDKPSPSRIKPPCEHFDSCGGCQLQHLDYQAQLSLKRDMVEQALRRLGGLDVVVRPVIGMTDPWRYRNKAQVPVGMDGPTVKAGFFARRSHRIVNVDCCLIQHPTNDRVVDVVRSVLKETGIPVYNEQEHTGLIRHVVARTSFSSGETLVVLVTNGHQIPGLDKLINALRSRLDNVAGIVQNINTRKGNVILGPEDVTLWGRPFLTENLHGLSFHISPRSFFQVNTVQTEALYKKVKEYAALTGNETVFDLYCGIGTIALYLSRHAGRVVGVESVAAAVDDARKNAKLNKIENAEFHIGLAEDVAPQLQRKWLSASVAVVDPPRKGCEQRLLDAIIKMEPSRLIYVSCNPATLARDLKYLTGHSFTVREVQPVDMFPHTTHVETVVLITRVKE